MGFDRLAEKMGACANPKRLEMLKLLSKEDMNQLEIVKKLKIAQSQASQHLKTLFLAGLVKKRSQGCEVWYSINRSAIDNILVNFSELGHQTEAAATAILKSAGHRAYQKSMGVNR